LQYTAVDRGLTGKNSTSILRKPGNKEDFVRGRAGQYPFAPGGLEVLAPTDEVERDRFKITEKTKLDELALIPPGFPRGLRLKSTTQDEDLDLDIGDEGDEVLEEKEFIRSVHLNYSLNGKKKEPVKTGYEGIDDLLPDEFPLLAAKGGSSSSKRIRGKEWAHVVDVNQEMTNFHELIPEMAHQVFRFRLELMSSIHSNLIISKKKLCTILKMETLCLWLHIHRQAKQW